MEQEKYSPSIKSPSLPVDENTPSETAYPTHEVERRFKKVSWQRLTVLLLVEGIALGVLSMPSVVSTLGLIPFIILTLVIGAMISAAATNIGDLFLRYPHLRSYVDVGRLLFGDPWGAALMSVMFCLLIILNGASHTLTGAIAWRSITQSHVCTIVLSVISAAILFFLALPPTFNDVAFLGYIDLASVLAAIIITIAGVAVAYPGSELVHWNLVPKPGTGFIDGINATLNIIFSYGFTPVLVSFMTEMDRPQDYRKSVWTLYVIEAIIYLGTGISIYLLVGDAVQSPALLSAGHTFTRIAFGISLPVIFISGAININVISRFIHNKIFQNHANQRHQYIATPVGIATWVALVAGVTFLGWIIAEIIPFFNLLLSLVAALFGGPFTLGFPGLVWLIVLRKEEAKEAPPTRKTTLQLVWNTFLVALCAFLMVAGVYSSVQGIIDEYAAGRVGKPFICRTKVL